MLNISFSSHLLFFYSQFFLPCLFFNILLHFVLQRISLHSGYEEPLHVKSHECTSALGCTHTNHTHVVNILIIISHFKYSLQTYRGSHVKLWCSLKGSMLGFARAPDTKVIITHTLTHTHSHTHSHTHNSLALCKLYCSISCCLHNLYVLDNFLFSFPQTLGK